MSFPRSELWVYERAAIFMVEAMQIWFMFIYACITFGNISRDHKVAGEFVTGKKTYE